LRLYQRKKTWWFELQFEGKRYRQSTKVKNRVKAEGIASKFRTALAERRVGIIERKPAPAFEKAMKAFLDFSNQEHQEHPKTHIRYKTSSKALLRFLKFKTKPVDQITPAAVEEYKSYRARQTSKRTKKPITPATINRELACLKAMFFHVRKEHKHIENPVCDVNLLDEGNQQDRVLTFQEQRTYLAVASETLRDIATLMLETGMRPEEVCRIEKTNVHLDEEYVFNPYGKTKAARRRIRLSAVAAAVLKKRLESAEGECLFPHRKDDNKPMLKVNNAHTTALRKSKLKYFRLYDCRHTFATRAAQNGMDLAALAAVLGHSKLNMVMRYAHPQEQHKADAMKQLEKANAAAEIAEFEKVHTKPPTPENSQVSEHAVN
jgi:integrase